MQNKVEEQENEQKIFLIMNSVRAESIVNLLMTDMFSRRNENYAMKKIEEIGIYFSVMEGESVNYAHTRDVLPKMTSLPAASEFDVLIIRLIREHRDLRLPRMRNLTAYGQMVLKVVADLKQVYGRHLAEGSLYFPTLLDVADAPYQAIRNCRRIDKIHPRTFILTEKRDCPCKKAVELGQDEDGRAISTAKYYNCEEIVRPRPQKTVKEISAQNKLINYIVALRSHGNDGELPIINWKSIKKHSGISRQYFFKYVKRKGLELDTFMSSEHGIDATPEIAARLEELAKELKQEKKAIRA